MENVIVKVLIGIVALVVIGTYIKPILVPLFPPFGVIALVALFVLVLLWLMGKI